MSFLTKDEHEGLLSELLQEDILTSRKTEILQQLRVSNTIAHEVYDKASKNIENLSKEKDDLLVANSMLFRKIGVQELGEQKQQEEEQKTFSESVTLEDLL